MFLTIARLTVMKDRVVIVDYGVGNIASIVNMLRYIGAEGHYTEDVATIRSATKLILPGIGSYKAGMEALRARGLEEPIKEAIANGAFTLGICLGFQLLFHESEEWRGGKGLGLVDGVVRRFQCEGQGLRVPHVGWNKISPAQNAKLFDNEKEELRYYFVHSYYAECADQNLVAATCDYGHDFVCSIQRDRLFGVQFHPEKSHKFGIDTFTRFVNLQC